jgi:hypothetical protein
MPRWTRRLLYLGLTLAVLFGGVRLAGSRLLSDLGLDWWSLPELYRRQEAGQKQAAALEQTCQDLLQRNAAKEHVIEELLAERLTLFQAAACFDCLNHEPPECAADCRRFFPGDSDGEKSCRQVLAWASATLRERGDPRREAVLARLEAQLTARLANSDGIDLRQDGGDGPAALPPSAKPRKPAPLRAE